MTYSMQHKFLVGLFRDESAKSPSPSVYILQHFNENVFTLISLVFTASQKCNPEANGATAHPLSAALCMYDQLSDSMYVGHFLYEPPTS